MLLARNLKTNLHVIHTIDAEQEGRKHVLGGFPISW